MAWPKTFALVSAAFAWLVLTPRPAQAFTTIFYEDFESNTACIAYCFNTAPNGWSVTNGSVDIVTYINGPGGFVQPSPGSIFVDLEGTIGAPGLLSRDLELVAGNTYKLFIDFAGSQRADSLLDTVQVSFGTTS